MKFEDQLRKRVKRSRAGSATIPRVVLLNDHEAGHLADLVDAVRRRRARHPNEPRAARLAKCVCDACEDEDRAMAAIDKATRV